MRKKFPQNLLMNVQLLYVLELSNGTIRLIANSFE